MGFFDYVTNELKGFGREVITTAPFIGSLMAVIDVTNYDGDLVQFCFDRHPHQRIAKLKRAGIDVIGYSGDPCEGHFGGCSFYVDKLDEARARRILGR